MKRPGILQVLGLVLGVWCDGRNPRRFGHKLAFHHLVTCLSKTDFDFRMGTTAILEFRSERLGIQGTFIHLKRRLQRPTLEKEVKVAVLHTFHTEGHDDEVIVLAVEEITGDFPDRPAVQDLFSGETLHRFDHPFDNREPILLPPLLPYPAGRHNPPPYVMNYAKMIWFNQTLVKTR